MCISLLSGNPTYWQKAVGKYHLIQQYPLAIHLSSAWSDAIQIYHEQQPDICIKLDQKICNTRLVKFELLTHHCKRPTLYALLFREAISHNIINEDCITAMIVSSWESHSLAAFLSLYLYLPSYLGYTREPYHYFKHQLHQASALDLFPCFSQELVHLDLFSFSAPSLMPFLFLLYHISIMFLLL